VSILFVFSLTILVQRNRHISCYVNHCSIVTFSNQCNRQAQTSSVRRLVIYFVAMNGFVYDLYPHLVHDSLELTPSHESAARMPSLASAVFAQYIHVRNAQTHRDTDIQTTLRQRSIAIGSIIHCTMCKRCDLKSLAISEKLRH